METTQVGFRMPNVLLEAIDKHVAWMQKHKPAQRYNRTDAIRELLVRWDYRRFKNSKSKIERTAVTNRRFVARSASCGS